MTDPKDPDSDVRTSLLQHYDAQAVAHAAGFLAMPVIALTIVQLHPQRPILLVALSVAFALIVRMFLTTRYWERMGHAIIRVSKDRGLNEIKESGISDKEKDYTDTGLESLVLHSAAHKWVRKHHKWLAQYGSITTPCSWLPIVLLADFSFVILLLGYDLLFITQG